MEGGGPSPHFEELVKRMGRVWYPVKVLHIRHNLFAGTETLSLCLRANRHVGFVTLNFTPHRQIEGHVAKMSSAHRSLYRQIIYLVGWWTRPPIWEEG